MRHEINELNEIRVYADGEDVPFLFQPDYPDTTPFADRADAEEWLRLYLLSLTDENAPYAPSSPGVAGEPKPTKEELEMRAKSQGFPM